VLPSSVTFDQIADLKPDGVFLSNGPGDPATANHIVGVTRDVLGAQLPLMPARADLVTCGIGINDILYTNPVKLFAGLRTLIAALPDQTVLLDLPLPAGCWGFLGRASVPYVTRINRTIHQAAAARGLPVAEVSAHFLPPWSGKFASDCFHPSQDGYRDWARALLDVVNSTERTGRVPW